MIKDNNSKIFRLVSIGFGVIGLGLLIGGWLTYRSTTHFLSTAVSATGTVINYERRNDSKGKASYFPVIRFQTGTGESVEFTSQSGSNTRGYRVGSQVLVLYAPGNPHEAEIDSFFALWFFPLILSVIGVGFSIAGVAGFIFLKEPQTGHLLTRRN